MRADGSNNLLEPKLILHVDIRNTLFAADSIGHLLVEQGINSYLTGVAWGTVNQQSGAWTPISSSPSLKPPCPGAITYYKYLETQSCAYSAEERAKLRLATANFVDEPMGIAFKPIFDRCLTHLKWNYERDDSITAQGLDGQNYHYIFKSFLNLIRYLTDQNRKFAVILRTFGIDSKGTLLAFDSTIKKKHPELPDGLGPISLCESVHHFIRQTNDMLITDSSSGREICSSETEIFDWMNAANGILAIKDDFMFWQSQKFVHTAGKPFWVSKDKPPVDAEGAPCFHIVIDDNIRTWETDSIVNFRSVENGVFRDLPASDISNLEHVCYEQADLINAICDPSYFINIVSTCESNMKKMYGLTFN